MTRTNQRKLSRGSDRGRDRVHFKGKLAFAENKSKQRQIAVVFKKRRGVHGNIRGKLRQNSLDFVGFLSFKKAKLVIGFNDRERLDEKRRTGSGRIVNQTLDLIFIFLLNGDNVTSVSHGNDLLLQKFGVRASRNIFLQGIADSIVFMSHFSADLVKRVAGGIRDHVLTGDTA